MSQNPAEGILPFQMDEYCREKALWFQQCIPFTTVHWNLNKGIFVVGEETVVEVVFWSVYLHFEL